MSESLPDFFETEAKRVLEACVECGVCAQKCPIIAKTDLAKIPPQDIQKEVKGFLRDKRPKDTVYTRAFSCMECFACIEKHCPQGLNPMLINDIIKWEYRRGNIFEPPYADPKDNESPQRILAGIQVSREEYGKIFTPTPHSRAKWVFFPGCNVYFQPEKILNALDIMNLITDDWAFLPGNDLCCGNAHQFSGTVEKADITYRELVERIMSYDPDSVIFWCPTCHCHFSKTISRIAPLPFRMTSFPQFLAEHMALLPLKAIKRKVTLHEACKSAYTAVDLTGVRDVLRKMPGIELVEMPRHGRYTACCGSGAAAFFPESLKTMRDERLLEASKTLADTLVDVCHYCHELFAAEEADYDFTVVNYITLMAEALGIQREDKYKKYKQRRNPEWTIKDAARSIEESPFPRRSIIQAIEESFAPDNVP